MSGRPVITFLSDYGIRDDFVGICHGVMAKLCPEGRVIDITHGIPRQDIRAGAIVLAEALPYMPAGVHLAVVDPDVGAQRRAVALRLADERTLVGPDNGLLWPSAQMAGGVVAAVDIAGSPFRLQPVSATFHGRDIFAPVAARLAAGANLAEAGDPLDPDELVRLELPSPRLQDGWLVTHVLYVDGFGNVQLDAGHEDLHAAGLRLGRAAELRTASGQRYTCPFVRTFADVEPGELLVYEDAYRRLAVAVSQGDAARRIAAAVDHELLIRPA
ncbi:MAG TPA: SAM-dependent chlorinase/fluorinase [Solirubrobacteraceae bacterium]|nr:SAM-dependent chlorinase/fluorinase [Solirubrobacteraceae bacterium]